MEDNINVVVNDNTEENDSELDPTSTSFHTPFPGPIWWKCYRIGSVSGKYEGYQSGKRNPSGFLELRVDIDPRHKNSPILNRISGDFYRVFQFSWPIGKKYRWKVYQESWIVDSPNIKWSKCKVTITGTLRFWKGTHPQTTIVITIPWGTLKPVKQAEVIFHENGSNTRKFTCSKKSNCFRNLNLEIDVVDSVNNEPILPSYDTDSHDTKPSDLPKRVLTVPEAYEEAGVCVRINSGRTIIDDSASNFSTWSVSELHDAMETYYSLYSGRWPAWKMWGLLCGSFTSSTTAGIMFDYSGANEPPERQGFAVFRNHSWFDNLSQNPSTQDEHWAMRQYLYAYVHEAGHAFNLMHSWDKGRADSLSWMNYPQYVTDFWDDFRFEFDEEELIHIRHGDRSAVIMGGDDWSTGGHLESTVDNMFQTDGDLPVELLVRSKEYFDFMEPVQLELRLKNNTTDTISIDTRLHPQDGQVVIHIRKPDGRIVQYLPVYWLESTPELTNLKPHSEQVGDDRKSVDISITHGKSGFYFDMPGEYLIRTTYTGLDGIIIPSNTHKIRIANPESKAQSQQAKNFFSHQAGMILSLNGSESPLLAKGKQILQTIIDENKENLIGAKIASVLAESEARSFFRIEGKSLKQIHEPDYDKSLKMTESALEIIRSTKSKALNMLYSSLVMTRTTNLTQVNRKKDAIHELQTLQKDLSARGVNQPVLDDIKYVENSIS